MTERQVRKTMKMTAMAGAIVCVAGLTGCTVAVPIARTSGAQVVRLDAKTQLVMRVEGTKTQPVSAESVPESNGTEPIHRILQSGDGTVLFAYDLQVFTRKGDEGEYAFALKPAATGPTLKSSRVVAVKARGEAIRVELMEQPDTGEKITDVFRLEDVPMVAKRLHETSFGEHVMQIHNAIFHWIHGS
jgi:hypothetical protein